MAEAIDNLGDIVTEALARVNTPTPRTQAAHTAGDASTPTDPPERWQHLNRNAGLDTMRVALGGEGPPRECPLRSPHLGVSDCRHARDTPAFR
jgi:hypothetical protein